MGAARRPTRSTDEHRLLQALNCLLVETPAGRVLVETGIGERLDDKVRDDARLRGRRRSLPALRAAGFEPGTVDVVAMSHLHFDHAGGLLRADGSRAFPRARIVAQRAEWEIALGDNPPARRLLRPAGAAARRATGARQGWADGERELLPGVSVVPDRRPLGRPPGDRRAGRGTGGRTLALLRRPVHAAVGANPRWVTAFDDFPLDSVEVKGELFARAADEGWTVVLSHEPLRPVGRLVRDRDRFRFEPL